MPAASASSLVVVPAKPLRAKSGTAAATMALWRSSLSSRVMAMAAQSKRLLTPRQFGRLASGFMDRVRPGCVLACQNPAGKIDPQSVNEPLGDLPKTVRVGVRFIGPICRTEQTLSVDHDEVVGRIVRQSDQQG